MERVDKRFMPSLLIPRTSSTSRYTYKSPGGPLMEANKKKNSNENQNHEDCNYRKNDFVTGNRQGGIFATYPLGPESPSPATLRMLPGLTPGGILTLMLFLIRTRPSPEHFRQFSEMISPSPPQFGHTETYDERERC